MTTQFWFLIIAMVMASFGATDRAEAQIMTPSLSLFYMQTSSKTQIPETADVHDSTRSTTIYNFVNLGVCYNIGGFCLGLKYLQGQVTSNVSAPGQKTSSTVLFHGPGITAGYSGSEGVVAHATLLLAAKKDIPSESKTYSARTAYMLELGYGFKVGTARIGPLLSLYQFNYDKRDINGKSSSLSPQEEDHFILPQLGFWLDI
ncbi:MAG: hypothetical protein H7249_06880 [Chitinophagaceae bacterium]|nr:hypothetical protein [Oligoflexus sp.]